MRLIDAEQIRELVAPIAPMLVGNDVHYERIALMDEIDQLPKIEAKPVVHAHWIPTCKPWSLFSDRTHKCSCCGHFLDMDGVNCGRGIAKYCPNCGAKMDEDK